jgi:hypothetical protein
VDGTHGAQQEAGARAWRDINYEIFAACMKGINPAIKQLQRITNAKQFMRPGQRRERERELTSTHNVPSLYTMAIFPHCWCVRRDKNAAERGICVFFFTAKHLSH